MGDDLRAPRERTCERCGRREVWSEADGCWQVAGADDGQVAADDDGQVAADDDPRVGRVFCIHEWDVTGTFTPVEDA